MNWKFDALQGSRWISDRSNYPRWDKHIIVCYTFWIDFQYCGEKWTRSLARLENTMALTTNELEMEVARLRMQVQMRAASGSHWVTEEEDEFDDSNLGWVSQLRLFTSHGQGLNLETALPILMSVMFQTQGFELNCWVPHGKLSTVNSTCKVVVPHWTVVPCKGL